MSLRVFTIILDGLGIGDLPDAADFGDSGCNTLAHLCEAVGGLSLPALESLGLGRAQPFAGMASAPRVRGAYGRILVERAVIDTHVFLAHHLVESEPHAGTLVGTVAVYDQTTVGIDS